MKQQQLKLPLETIILLAICLFLTSSLSAQVRVNGYVYDAQNKETLIGASFYNPVTKTGTTSNNYGFYSLSLAKGQSNIVVSYVGFDKQLLQLNLTKDTTINIYLQASSTLKEVVITDKSVEKQFVKESTIGKITLSPESIIAIPTLAGESDLLKALQMLPGVKSGTEGTTGLYVRGGNVDQNLYLVDGIPIYNPNHLMGFISTFNTNAIKSINFYKGSFPSQYGQRVSSVVDTRMKDGNNQQIKGEASIGLLSAHLDVEGPIVKDKTTFSFSGRRTYLDLLLKPLLGYENNQNDQDMDFGYHFSDINMKITHRFSQKSLLTASIYWGEDKFNLTYKENDDKTEQGKMNNTVKWGNTIATLNWAQEISNRLFSNLSLSYNLYRSTITASSDYTTKQSNQATTTYKFQYDFLSSIEDWTIKNDYNLYLNSLNYVTFGVNYTYHTYRPEQSSAMDIENSTPNNYFNTNKKIFGNEAVAYIEDEITINEKLLTTAGVHYTLFNVQGKTYHSLEPRLSVRYSISDDLSLKAGYATMSQYIHLLANGIISSPTDLWVPITKNIAPISSNQVSLGLFYQLNNVANLSIEGYYKKLNNVIDYKDGVSTFNSSEDWEEKVAQGKGESYGFEILAKKDKGNDVGWLSYTLSWSYRQFPNGEINAGQRFFDRYDSRHQINIVYTHKFGKRIDLTMCWVFNSGSRTSVPIASYYAPIDQSENVRLVQVYGQRNNFKMPSYHRLDISLNFHKQTKHGQRIWSINIYNAYNRKNAFLVYTSNKPNTLKAISIMPLIPTVSYTYKFR